MLPPSMLLPPQPQVPSGPADGRGPGRPAGCVCLRYARGRTGRGRGTQRAGGPDGGAWGEGRGPPPGAWGGGRRAMLARGRKTGFRTRACWAQTGPTSAPFPTQAAGPTCLTTRGGPPTTPPISAAAAAAAALPAGLTRPCLLAAPADVREAVALPPPGRSRWACPWRVAPCEGDRTAGRPGGRAAGRRRLGRAESCCFGPRALGQGPAQCCAPALGPRPCPVLRRPTP
jgi:hypothetical protein